MMEKNINYELIVDEFYRINKKLPNVFEIAERTGKDITTVREQCSFVPNVISEIKQAFVRFAESEYEVHSNIIISELSPAYPPYKAFELQLTGLDEDNMSVVIALNGNSLLIKMEATNLPEISKCLKKSYKNYIATNCSADGKAYIQTGFFSTVGSKEVGNICPYHRMKIAFHEFTMDDVMEEMVDFILKNKKLFSYLQLVNGNTESNAETVKKVLDETGIRVLENDSQIVAIAQAILEISGEEGLTVKFSDTDILRMELINSSVKIFIDSQMCYLLADLGKINEEDKNDLLTGDLQPWFNLDSGTDGYLYVDSNGHLRYSLLFNYKKVPAKKTLKLIKKRVGFAMKMKTCYKNYLSTVYGTEEILE